MTAGDPCNCPPWPVEPDCCTGWPGPDAPDADKARAARAVRIASDRLRRLTAGRWGVCEEVLRPCKQPCGPASPDMYDQWPIRSPYAGAILDPYVWGGRMRNRACGCATDDCSCGPVCKVQLPGPVDEVLAVKIDGGVLDPSAYFVNAVGELIRTDGGCFPDCQDMAKRDTEPGTFSVRYMRGRNPEDDADAIRAVSVLACELYKNLCGQKCRIPGRVRTIQREGVTYDIVTDWPKQGTGLDEVDDWLVLINPTGARSVPTVTTPDLPRYRYYNGQDC